MFLDAIVNDVDARVQRLRPVASWLREQAELMPPGRSLQGALRDIKQGVAVIAECKQKSPSKGWLTKNYHPIEQARYYQQTGAQAVSVLTEPHFFAGDLAHLRAVSSTITLPVLRKDFVRDEVQLSEARANGADAALLIVRIVDAVQLRDLYQVAESIGLEVLVEIHSLDELDTALTLNPSILGVNNRDLDSFETRLEFSQSLSPLIPPEVIKVSESGIRSLKDIERVQEWGYDAVLVGESLMRGNALLEERAHGYHG